MVKEYQCPQCQEIIERNSKYFPFCSERCKLIDLGNWATGKYAVPAVEDPEDGDVAQDDEGSD